LPDSAEISRDSARQSIERERDDHPPKSFPKGKAEAGRYQFARRIYSQTQDRHIPVACRRKFGEYVHSCILNPSDNTKNVFFVGVDLDASRADPENLDEAGRIDEGKLISALERFPQIQEHVTALKRSRSGTGIHVIFGISPFALTPSDADASDPRTQALLNIRKRSRITQAQLVEFFSELGLGADPAAIGPRYWSNWIDGECIFKKERWQYPLKRDRTPVLRLLSDSLRMILPEIRVRLYPDARVELGVAKLLLTLLGEIEPPDGWPRRMPMDTSSAYLTMGQMQEVSGASDRFIRKLLAGMTDCPFLRGEYLASERHWRVDLLIPQDFRRLLDRARVVVRTGGERLLTRESKGTVAPETLPQPKDVEDGQRNNFVWRLAALYRLVGIDEQEARSLAGHIITHIPGYLTSTSCKQAPSIISSIYRSHSELFGLWPESKAPAWSLRPSLLGAAKESLTQEHFGAEQLIEGPPGVMDSSLEKSIAQVSVFPPARAGASALNVEPQCKQEGTPDATASTGSHPVTFRGDGPWNRWLLDLALTLKRGGVPCREAEKALFVRAETLAPGFQRRVHGAELGLVVRHVYRHQQETFGSSAFTPLWLTDDTEFKRMVASGVAHRVARVPSEPQAALDEEVSPA
jgi:hypothetical protein